MENLPPLPKVSFNHCVILFCSSACNCLKRPSTAAPTKTYSETETNSSRKDYIQTIKLCRNHRWKSLQFFSIFRPRSWSPRVLPPSQNPAKDPRGTPEHSTSILLRRRPWDSYISFQLLEVVLHMNPTCGVEAELGIQTRHFGRLELHNGPHYSPENSANIAKVTIPVQSCSSFDWVGRHRSNVVKVRKAILHHWHHMSWTVT